MTFIVATNVIASQPPDRLERRTLVPKVDKTSNIVKLVLLTIDLLPINESK